MADQSSCTAFIISKIRAFLELLLGWIEGPNLANASAGLLNSTQIYTAAGTDPVPGNDAGSAEPAASSGIVTLNQDPMTPLQSDPMTPLQSVRPLSPDLQVPAVQEQTSLTSTRTEESSSTNSQMPVSDWKVTAKQGFGVASRFLQSLLKILPECVDPTNPVKMALSIANAIIQIKTAVEDNQDELAQYLEQTAKKILVVERTVAIGVSHRAEKEMKKLEQALREDMKKLEDLAHESLVLRTLDYEECQKKIRQIFQNISNSMVTFLFEMGMSIQETVNVVQEDIMKVVFERLRPSKKADHKTVLEGQGLKREACTDGTRVKILEDITNWANDGSPASPHVFWLTGQAGSGKTTIAYTIAKRFEKDGEANERTVLGGNFLCSRQFQETQSRTRIIPTIAYQLARRCKSYADALHVADKFDAVDHDVSHQMKDLLLGPWKLSDAKRPPELPPYLIVIDAVDEIKDGRGSAFLRDLLRAIIEDNLKGLKFLVTSRSNPEIVALCKSFLPDSEAVCRLQDVPIEEANLDIRTYLNIKLPKLAGSPELEKVEQQAGGLFIYAATVVRYLTRHHSISTKEQTEMLNDLLSKSASASATMTGPIDELYAQIMHEAFSDFEGTTLTRRLRILYTFLCTAERTSTSIAAALIADNDDEAATAILDDFHAVLYKQDNQVFWYHASFPEFIFDPTRSNFRIGEKDFQFSCNEPAHHKLLCESCFNVMSRDLRFNMGNIASSFLFDRDNDAVLSEQVAQNITPILNYSSRHWTHHLPLSPLVGANILCDYISNFLQIHVLFWIEAMNLLQLRNQCTPMLKRAHEWVLKYGNGHSGLVRDISEAANFATYFTGSPTAESTPHLYISALATWSRETSLSRNWKKQFPHIPVFTHAKSGIDLPLMMIPAGGRIMSVAFSSDGTWIVSGSNDKSVQVWDASTGDLVKELKGHTDSVNSVAFSTHGTLIVSGSDDKSVRVWDALTGGQLKELKGHTSFVNSVAFSSDGTTQIVSGSSDESVRVWDVSKGLERMELEGHTQSVFSVAFSSDDNWVVSGSHDNSVRLWNASTGTQLRELIGHTDLVNSVALSSNGTLIASGSSDNSVRLWDTSTGEQLREFKGHTKSVNSVALSSDGTLIASGSSDNSVRLWDALTGEQLREFKGHTKSVNSVALSSAGTLIASGSSDNSVRLWDASTGKQPKDANSVKSVALSGDGTWFMSGSHDNSVQLWDASTGMQAKKSKGHTNAVNSVAFSNDGKWIVSGSHDNSVRLWDASTGMQVNKLKGHANSVNSVAFSSDSKRIVSGSHDTSVRLWDALTGMQLEELKGHSDLVNSVAFSRDGNLIASGSHDNSVRLWDALTGKQLKEFKGHTNAVKSVAFSSDGRWIVSGSHDNSVQLWEVSTGNQLNLASMGRHFVRQVRGLFLVVF